MLPLPYHFQVSLFLAASLLFFACSSSPEEKVETPPTPEIKTDAQIAKPKREVKMKTKGKRPHHFAFLTAAKDTLLFSDVKATHESLLWLAVDEENETKEEWKPFSSKLKTIAKKAATSTNITELTTAISRSAQICGDCHKALSVTPEIAVKEPKNRGLGFKDHMAGHRWALDKMWAGLATPSDAYWVEGAGLLAKTPTHLRSLSTYGSDADKAMQWATTVHSIAAEAATETDTAKRVELFGTFLKACALCHELPGSAPTPAVSNEVKN